MFNIKIILTALIIFICIKTPDQNLCVKNWKVTSNYDAKHHYYSDSCDWTITNLDEYISVKNKVLDSIVKAYLSSSQDTNVVKIIEANSIDFRINGYKTYHILGESIDVFSIAWMSDSLRYFMFTHSLFYTTKFGSIYVNRVRYGYHHDFMKLLSINNYSYNNILNKLTDSVFLDSFFIKRY